jgi:hypothetical protein
MPVHEKKSPCFRAQLFNRDEEGQEDRDESDGSSFGIDIGQHVSFFGGTIIYKIFGFL